MRVEHSRYQLWAEEWRLEEIFADDWCNGRDKSAAYSYQALISNTLQMLIITSCFRVAGAKQPPLEGCPLNAPFGVLPDPPSF